MEYAGGIMTQLQFEMVVGFGVTMFVLASVTAWLLSDKPRIHYKGKENDRHTVRDNIHGLVVGHGCGNTCGLAARR